MSAAPQASAAEGKLVRDTLLVVLIVALAAGIAWARAHAIPAEARRRFAAATEEQRRAWRAADARLGRLDATSRAALDGFVADLAEEPERDRLAAAGAWLLSVTDRFAPADLAALAAAPDGTARMAALEAGLKRVEDAAGTVVRDVADHAQFAPLPETARGGGAAPALAKRLLARLSPTDPRAKRVADWGSEGVLTPLAALAHLQREPLDRQGKMALNAASLAMAHRGMSGSLVPNHKQRGTVFEAYTDEQRDDFCRMLVDLYSFVPSLRGERDYIPVSPAVARKLLGAASEESERQVVEFLETELTRLRRQCRRYESFLARNPNDPGRFAPEGVRAEVRRLATLLPSAGETLPELREADFNGVTKASRKPDKPNKQKAMEKLIDRVMERKGAMPK